MQNRKEADRGAQMLGVGGNGEQRFGNSAEENAINHFFVEKGDFGDLFGQSENDVEVLDRQQFGMPACEPLRPRHTLALPRGEDAQESDPGTRSVYFNATRLGQCRFRQEL